MSCKNVGESRAALAILLDAHPDVLPFRSFRVASVEVLAGRRGKKLIKRQDKADTPSERGNCVLVYLEPESALPVESAGHTAVAGVNSLPAPAVIEGQVRELIEALERAETTPGHSFVALKWFRDTFLLQQGYGWTESAEARDRVLRAAVGRGYIQVDKIPNPRNPGFATSVLRLQGQLPEVQAMLGKTPRLGWDFKPITLRGEPMSETLRRMRDEGY